MQPQRRAGRLAALIVLVAFAVVLAATQPETDVANAAVALPPGSRWIDAPSGDGFRARGLLLDAPERRPVVVMAASTAGVTAEDFRLARALRDRGFHVVLACWFNQPNERPGVYACPDARPSATVSDAHLADFDGVVTATTQQLGDRAGPVVVAGYSRGGGLAVLRAARGRPEPVVAIAPLLSGRLATGATAQGDTDVVALAGEVNAPTLVLHGTRDRIVAYADSARFVSRCTNASLSSYEEVDHDIAWRADLTGRVADDIATFVRRTTTT